MEKYILIFVHVWAESRSVDILNFSTSYFNKYIVGEGFKIIRADILRIVRRISKCHWGEELYER